MSDFRETRIERDERGNVVGSTERIVERADTGDRGRASDATEPRRSGTGRGLLLGVLLAGAALIAFAVSQGGFSEAGREADRATALAEQELSIAAEQAGDAAENAGDTIERATD